MDVQDKDKAKEELEKLKSENVKLKEQLSEMSKNLTKEHDENIVLREAVNLCLTSSLYYRTFKFNELYNNVKHLLLKHNENGSNNEK